MRNTVRFRYPAQVVVVSDDDGVLSIDGAGWFVDVLRTIPGIALGHDLVQEDSGVVVRAERAGLGYMILLSSIGAIGEQEWIAHVHDAPLALIQRFSARGRAARAALSRDVDRALRAAGATELRWFEERDLNLRDAAETPG